MMRIQKQSDLPYTPAQMYALVADIEHYPDFVPGCTKSVILFQNEKEVQARLEFTKKGISQSFSTLNRLYKDKKMELRLLEGPFRYLEGYWQFDEIEKGCRISFYLEFQLANRLLDLALGSFFQAITQDFVDAFEKRADQLYGQAKNNAD